MGEHNGPIYDAEEHVSRLIEELADVVKQRDAAEEARDGAQRVAVELKLEIADLQRQVTDAERSRDVWRMMYKADCKPGVIGDLSVRVEAAEARERAANETVKRLREALGSTLNCLKTARLIYIESYGKKAEQDSGGRITAKVIANAEAALEATPQPDVSPMMDDTDASGMPVYRPKGSPPQQSDAGQRERESGIICTCGHSSGEHSFRDAYCRAKGENGEYLDECMAFREARAGADGGE